MLHAMFFSDAELYFFLEDSSWVSENQPEAEWVTRMPDLIQQLTETHFTPILSSRQQT